MNRLVDYGDGLIAPLASARTADQERAVAWEQEADKFHHSADALMEKSKGKPVRVRMPKTGATFYAGGECLVQALANGAQPVEL